MKKMIALLLSAITLCVQAQDWPVKSLVKQKKAAQVLFQKIPALRFVANKKLTDRESYQQLSLQASFKKTVAETRPEAIEIILPVEKNKSITLQLVRFSLGNFQVTRNNSEVLENIKMPVTYRGIVAEEPARNNVLLTVNEDYISLMVYFQDKLLQVTKANETGELYRLYNSSKMTFPPGNLNCGNTETSSSKTITDYRPVPGNTPAAVRDKCVNVFIDCSDSLYLNRSSSIQRTVDFVNELLTGVATCFYNDSINLQLTTINVWTTDPYVGNTREILVRQLADYYKDAFWGNICVGLDFTSLRLGGLADDIGRVKGTMLNTCPAYGADVSACCYNDLADGAIAQNFPVGFNTNNSQMYLVTHEIGHLLGSRHTKWCGWELTQNPSTYGRIDSCGAYETFNGDSCVLGPAPSNGGTIMSYCFQGTSFVNFNNGFGPLPGKVIRQFVDNNACIGRCDECFGFIWSPGDNDLAVQFSQYHYTICHLLKNIPIKHITSLQKK